ncbi:MAG: hypothetical protein LBO74_08480 [Candidatus Symbiothrix sp.]|jgi:hypothetical protein|nr:hypothetical protein [Candidatus Symbiothrix sp.]
MEQKGYISEFMAGGRIVSHGKISDLTNGFSLPGNVPFSIYVKPKFVVSDIDAFLNVKCYQDENASEAPIVLNDWSPLAIVEIAPNSDILAQNDIYWGSGSNV